MEGFTLTSTEIFMISFVLGFLFGMGLTYALFLGRVKARENIKREVR